MSQTYDVETSPSEFGIPALEEPGDISEAERQRMREEYGYVRTFFKIRPRSHRTIQRRLNQARLGQTYDEYLATSVHYAAVAAILGAALGAAVAWQLVATGVIAGLTSPWAIGGGLATFLSDHRAIVAGAVLTLGLATLFGFGTWTVRYYLPNVVVSSRRQNINVVLPYAIVYMYALSRGGMNLIEVMRSLSGAEEVYGEIAREFEMIVTDIELFGNDVYTALQNARNLTPSDGFEQFLDDLVSVLDSGADATVFFEEAADRYREQAEAEQENFLETLSLLAEVFVVAFVAAPLFIMVTLVVMSFIGGDTVDSVSVLVYAVMPLAMVGFMVLLDVLSQPYKQVGGDGILASAADRDRGMPTGPSIDPESDERYERYRRRKRLLSLLALVRSPVTVLRRRPLLSLVVTIPAAVVTVAVAAMLDLATLSMAAFVATPLATTVTFVVVPFLLVAVPLSAFWELKRRREHEIARRFPDTLNILSSANKMGIRFTEAIDLVARWSTGLVGRELRVLRNDVAWNHDTTTALLTFGRRTEVPQLSRTMKLLADGIRSSGDISRVLSIAAEDTRNRHRMERARRRELSTYVVVVVIGFLVYLLVVLMLDASYLQPLSEATDPGDLPSGTELPVSLDGVVVERYHALFLHSALIQAVGSGLLAGKLAHNDTLSGLKYGIALVVLTLVAFTFV